MIVGLHLSVQINAARQSFFHLIRKLASKKIILNFCTVPYFTGGPKPDTYSVKKLKIKYQNDILTSKP